MHFITTIEDYFTNRATYLESITFQNNLAKFKEHNQEVQDMDDIIKLHDNYITRVFQLCLLDVKSQELLKHIM